MGMSGTVMPVRWALYDLYLIGGWPQTFMLMLLLQAGKQFVCLFIEPKALWCVLKYIFNILLLVRLWLKFFVRTFSKVMLYRISQESATSYLLQTMFNNFDSIFLPCLAFIRFDLLKRTAQYRRKIILSNAIYKCTKSHVIWCPKSKTK